MTNADVQTIEHRGGYKDYEGDPYCTPVKFHAGRDRGLLPMGTAFQEDGNHKG